MRCNPFHLRKMLFVCVEYVIHYSLYHCLLRILYIANQEIRLAVFHLHQACCTLINQAAMA